jgi:uncharacterized membrane protein
MMRLLLWLPDTARGARVNCRHAPGQDWPKRDITDGHGGGTLRGTLSVMRYEKTIEINAPTDAIWSVISDVAKWPEWTASIREVELLAPQPLRLGSRVKVRQPKLPTAVWEVTDFQPGRSFTWVNRSPGMTSTGVHEIVGTADKPRVRLMIDQSGPLSFVARLFLPTTRRYVDMEAAGLKKRCES